MMSSKLATGFLLFEGLFFGLMMAFAYVAPLDFVSGVTEVPKEDLATILTDNLSGGALEYGTWLAVDNDNVHGMVVFMALVAFHTAVKVTQSDRTWIFACFVVAHGCIVLNQTKALNGNYYIAVDIAAATKYFAPARLLHSFFTLVHLAFFVKNILNGERKKSKAN